jgi:phosphoserine phosphatase
MPTCLLPVCIDLDGTLIQTDVLLESLLIYVKKFPWKSVLLLYWLIQGRALLKKKVADEIDLDILSLPVNQKIIDLILSYRKKGHKIYLVTAAAEKYGYAVAKHFSFFDEVLTSDIHTNLRSTNKAHALIKKCGDEGYIYAGNSVHDLPVWEHAAEIVAINLSPKILQKATCLGKPMTVLYEEVRWAKEAWKRLLQKLWFSLSA